MPVNLHGPPLGAMIQTSTHILFTVLFRENIVPDAQVEAARVGLAGVIKIFIRNPFSGLDFD